MFDCMGNDAFDWEENGAYRSIVECAPVPLAIVDVGGRLLVANRAARELGVEANLAPIIELISRSDTGGASAEVALTDRRGTARRVEITVTDRADGVRVLALRDVTERAQEREELAQLRRIESVGIVAAGAIHDFNNLLTPILCSSTLLSGELEASSRAARMAHEIRAAAERAAALSRQILRIARRSPPRHVHVDANAALLDMRSLIRLALPGDVDLAIAGTEVPAEVLVDREELEGALLNLVANARDAMPRGGRLTISAATCGVGDAGETSPGEGAGPGYVSIAVTDTGVGMPTGVRERLFEKFFTTKPRGVGTGLGLASVHAFVRRHGGCVSVRSHPGEGTTVVMYFPRAEPVRPVPPPPALESRPREDGSETILVVESEDEVRRTIRDVLERHGYHVFEAPDGDRALYQMEAQAGQIDLVLADFVMLRMSGPTLAERIRSAGHDAAVLFMSGHSDAVVAQRAGARPPKDLLRKAFSPGELTRSVRAVLDARAESAMPGV
jgi:two-component system cell cycle sensor histidine kinase/response regulator CckA